MSSLPGVRLGLAILSVAACIISCQAADQVILPGAVITPNPSLTDGLKKSFGDLTRSKTTIRSKTTSSNGANWVTAWCGDCCDCGIGCCGNSGNEFRPPVRGGLSAFFDRLVQPTATSTPSHTYGSDSSAAPAPTLQPPNSSWVIVPTPTTFLNSKPIRSTIFRDSTTVSEPSANASPDPSAAAIRDITDTYYDFTLQGHNHFIMPLVILDNKGDPLSLLAKAAPVSPYSFVSSSLIHDLGLTKDIDKTAKDISNADLSRIFGFETHSHGVIILDFIAGSNDRKLTDNRFVVFDPPSRPEGPLMPDLVVGGIFLTQAGALKLTDEYTKDGVKEGLGVLVQRVFGPEGLTEQEGGFTDHDEL